MKLKRLASLFLAAALLLSMPVGAAGLAVYPYAETGQRLVCGGEEQDVSAYNINGNNYFKLRDIAALLCAAVHWDEASQTIELVPAA